MVDVRRRETCEADGIRRTARDMRRMAYAGERKRELSGGW